MRAALDAEPAYAAFRAAALRRARHLSALAPAVTQAFPLL
jgi:hypothetical protein